MLRLKKKTAAAPAPAPTSTLDTLPRSTSTTSSSAISIRSASSISIRSISGSLKGMLGKVGASLKRRRDDMDDDASEAASIDQQQQQRGGMYVAQMSRAQVLMAATSEVVRRSTADARPADVVAQHQGFTIPGAWDEVGVSSSSSRTSLYPSLPPLQASNSPSLPVPPSQSPATAAVPTAAPAEAQAGPSSAAPPSVSTAAFEAAMADLNARLAAKGKGTDTTKLKESLDQIAVSPLQLASSSGSAKPSSLKRSTADRFKSAHEKMFKKSDSIASHYATLRSTKKKKVAFAKSPVKGQAAATEGTSSLSAGTQASTQAASSSSSTQSIAEPPRKRSKLNLNLPPFKATPKVPRPNPPPTPLDVLSSPKRAPLPKKETIIAKKPSSSTLNSKKSAAMLRAKPSTSSLKSQSAAETPKTGTANPIDKSSVRFSHSQMCLFENETADESVSAEKGSSAVSSPWYDFARSPARPNASLAAARLGMRPNISDGAFETPGCAASRSYLDVIATPPRPGPSTARPAVTASQTRATATASTAGGSLRKKPLASSVSSTVLSALMTPPRAASSFGTIAALAPSAGAGNKATGPLQKRTAPPAAAAAATAAARTNPAGGPGAAKSVITASRSAGRFHPYGRTGGVSSARPRAGPRGAPAAGASNSARGAGSSSTMMVASKTMGALPSSSSATSRISAVAQRQARQAAAAATTTAKTANAATKRACPVRGVQSKPAASAVPASKPVDKPAQASATAEPVQFPAAPTHDPADTSASAPPPAASGSAGVEAALAAAPAAPTRRPRIDRGQIMRRVRAAAEAGDGMEMDLDAMMMDVDGNDDVDMSVDPVRVDRTTSSTAKGPEPASTAEVPGPVPAAFPQPLHPQAPATSTTSTSPDSIPAAALGDIMGKVSRKAPTMSTSASLPGMVTLSTGLSARLPPRTNAGKRKADAPLPLPVPPPQPKGSRLSAARVGPPNGAASSSGTRGKGRRVPSGGGARAGLKADGKVNGASVADENMAPSTSRASFSDVRTAVRKSGEGSVDSLKLASSTSSAAPDSEMFLPASASASSDASSGRVALQVATLNSRDSSCSVASAARDSAQIAENDEKARSKTATSTRRKAPAAASAATPAAKKRKASVAVASSGNADAQSAQFTAPILLASASTGRITRASARLAAAGKAKA
ncbi:hypothetical protein OC834_005953 [Tilletia horrida]|nr:hypothetical protein OC834_005953 [Tilletia horrida]